MTIFKDTTPPEAFETIANRMESVAKRLMSGDKSEAALDSAASGLLQLADVYRDEAKVRRERIAAALEPAFEKRFGMATPETMRAAANSIRKALDAPESAEARTGIFCAATVLLTLFDKEVQKKGGAR